MPPSTTFFFFFLALALLLTLVAASASSSSSGSALFCKCTCFTNSTIIPLPAAKSCSDCNRQFCIDYNLPICKNAKKEEDVVTTCFQRDSLKDQVVVCVFIIATFGLLTWALAGPYIRGWVDRARAAGRGREAGYVGVPGG